MADIQFQEEGQYQKSAQFAEEKPFFVRLVLSTGIVSSEKAANYILLGVAVLMIILAIAIPILMGSQPAEKIDQSQFYGM